MGCGLATAADMLGESRRDLARQRHVVIAANPELRERELAKAAGYAVAVIDTLHQRGVGEPQASLAAEMGMMVFGVALEQWSRGIDDRSLAEVMRDSMVGLRTVAGTAE